MAKHQPQKLQRIASDHIPYEVLFDSFRAPTKIPRQRDGWRPRPQPMPHPLSYTAVTIANADQVKAKNW